MTRTGRQPPSSRLVLRSRLLRDSCARRPAAKTPAAGGSKGHGSCRPLHQHRSLHCAAQEWIVFASTLGFGRRRDRVPSRLQCCQLVEVGVVVRDVETVDPGARKDDQVRKRDGHA